MYLGLAGDPLVPVYTVYESENDARRAMSSGAVYGYIPAAINRNMIVPAD